LAACVAGACSVALPEMAHAGTECLTVGETVCAPVIVSGDRGSVLGCEAIVITKPNGDPLVIAIQHSHCLTRTPHGIGEFLDPGLMRADMDDFGGPFGWAHRPLLHPLRSRTGSGIDKPAPQMEDLDKLSAPLGEGK
jgi:hypothetical protein